MPEIMEEGDFMKKRKFLIFYSFLLIIIFCFFNPIQSTVSAAIFDKTQELIDKLNNALQTIETWLLTLATPAAAVAIGAGVFMKKFSFGDEEIIRTAKKLIRGSLFSYGFILLINLVLSAIQMLVGAEV